MKEYFAKIVEHNGRISHIRIPASAHDLEWFSERGFLHFAGLEEPLLKRKTIATKPVVIDGEVVIARIYENMTPKDYDNEMESYLYAVRAERGYTLREPSPTYDDSPNPRWKSDAKDWKSFFNAVMQYGLDVQNAFIASGNAPTLAEFKAGFPKMVWTYTEEV